MDTGATTAEGEGREEGGDDGKVFWALSNAKKKHIFISL